MLLHLSDQSPLSLQQQIVQQLRAMVLKGALAAGESLPSIRGFAQECQVSVITVHRAYESLERLGLIHSRRGKGFFVSAHTSEGLIALAEETLVQQMRRPVGQALAEGLTAADIQRVLAALVAEQQQSHGQQP